ncbi:MAG: hypothetical protein NVS4B12_00840 [Ktedonobacteraceae bacterium]
MLNTTSEVKETERPPLETAPQRSGGWLRRLLRRTRLRFAGDNEALMVENITQLAWRIYHDYHLLGIIDANEACTFQLTKRGILNVRPLEGENVEYLVLSLNDTIHYVRIYRRHLSKEVEVYDMQHVA